MVWTGCLVLYTLFTIHRSALPADGQTSNEADVFDCKQSRPIVPQRGY